MTIQANFPSIKPTLMLSFADTKQLDPRITFTRASTATVYDGKTFAMAEQNLLLQSQNYSATWTVTNLTPVTGKTAPDSTSTATEFTAGAANAVLTQGYTAIAGSYTFSVWLRRVTGTGDIQIASDNGTWTTKALTGTWARYDVTQTVAAGSKTAGVRVVTSGDVIEIWGAQLEQRSSVTAYTATTTQPITNYIPVLMTAANGVARFDHNPVTGESLGLLIEEQRTNLLTYSEQFDNAAWIKTNSTITANTIVAPDGALTGDKLVENTANSTHQLATAATSSATSATFSFYAKPAERSEIIVQCYTSPANTGGTVQFNLLSKTVVSQTVISTGTVSGASITDVGDGWVRCVVSVTGTSSTNLVGVIYLVSGTNTYTGNGYSGIFIWGAQLEAGAFPTSYIKTEASQVTRAADAASMTGTNFSSWYRADEGTLYAEAVPAFNGTNTLVVINDNTNSNAINFYFSGSAQVQVQAGNAQQALLAFAASSGYKITAAYKRDDFAASLNASTAQTDTAGIVPLVNQMRIGQLAAGSSPLNGTIKKIAYYPLRITNAQLQGLTS